jgi:cyclic-di-GMP-binding protein
LKSFDVGELEPAAGGTVRRVITLRSGIPKDKSKPLMEKIKALKLKVNAQYQDEQIRVSGKSRDDLQKVISELKNMNFELPLQFTNYR